MKSLEFYVNKVKYIDGIENADLSFIPALSRRRMSNLDKITAASINHCIDDDTEYIVFASKNGEVEQLLKIISQYKTQSEVSPASFSGSVHNCAVSSYLLTKKKAIPYTALSAGKETISNALLSTIISKYNNTLFVYSDIENDKYISLCINFSKKKEDKSLKYIIKSIENKDRRTDVSDFRDLFLNKRNSIETASYRIERITND